MAKNPTDIYATIKKKMSEGYLCSNKVNNKDFLLKNLSLPYFVSNFMIKNEVKFYVYVIPGKKANSYIAVKDKTEEKITIIANRVFIKEITPDMFVFKADDGFYIYVSGVKRYGMTAKNIKEKNRFRLACKITNRKAEDGSPIFEYENAKPLKGD